MTLRHTILLTALMVLAIPAGYADEPSLQGRVTDAQLHADAQRTKVNIDLPSDSFSMPANTAASKAATQSSQMDWPKRAEFPTMDSFFAAARQPRTDATAGGATGNQPPVSTEPPPAPPKKSIIIRMTGFNEDTEITPKINYDAIGIANKILETGERECIILLERNGVKLGTSGYTEMSVNGNIVDFRKSLRQFMANGGKIKLNGTWCKELMVQQRDLLFGVEIIDEPDLAKLILDSEKIVDYAAPVYPANVRYRFGVTEKPTN